MTVRAVDLFAGPGGWDEGLRDLGVFPLGIEWDDAACATRRAAGHRTLQADVAALNPRLFKGCEMLMASPPCPTFSTAGKRSGLGDMELILGCARALVDGADTREQVRPQLADPRSMLVVEPLRWVLELRPRWVAMEQVPTVLDLWRFYAGVLDQAGYSAWAGTLQSEQFGVPQTRERAFLIASLDGRPAHPPAPTHQRYVHGEAAREEHTLEGVLLPWVSMAEALGWGMTRRPYPTVACSRGSGGPDKEKVGGSGARKALYREQADGWWIRLEERQAHGARRDGDEPAPTLTSSMDNGNFRWLVNTGRDWKPGGTRETAQTFIADGRPAPTIDGKGRWFATRPATTIQGDPRVFHPGGHIANDGRDNSRMVGRSESAIRVEIEEAAVLQGFPPDYPFQGTKSKRFEQVGNAVPPPVARAVVAALLDVEAAERAA